MKYRRLGKTGLEVSEIGYGTWMIANNRNLWVGADIDESLQSLHKFAELGGNYVDTAWLYGFDKALPDRHPSEELVGRFLKERGRGDIVVSTKIPAKNGVMPARKGVPMDEVFPPGHIRQCVDDSLRSLGQDVLDIVQFHVWQDEYVDRDDWKETILDLTERGKVKFWGISVNDYQPSNCFRALGTGLISTIQFIFNLFHQKPAVKLLPYAREHDIGLIARVVFDEGGLTGNVTPSTVSADGDFRPMYFQGDRLAELAKHLDGLRELLDGEAGSLPELALRYPLSYDAVSTVVPGMRKMKNVLANVAVSDGRRLSPQMLENLKSHSWERNFYPNPDPALEATGFVEP
ncbi:MAG TPA: aldo/keto reductase [Acidimicrobiales bacterium]|nr:aldo/keto reductase [Acidimicrobiales bacterium]